jgi:hypothetical protein
MLVGLYVTFREIRTASMAVEVSATITWNVVNVIAQGASTPRVS